MTFGQSSSFSLSLKKGEERGVSLMTFLAGDWGGCIPEALFEEFVCAGDYFIPLERGAGIGFI